MTFHKVAEYTNRFLPTPMPYPLRAPPTVSPAAREEKNMTNTQHVKPLKRERNKVRGIEERRARFGEVQETRDCIDQVQRGRCGCADDGDDDACLNPDPEF